MLLVIVTHYKHITNLNQKACFICYKSYLIGKLSNFILFIVSSAEYAASEFTTYIVQWYTRKMKIIFKKGPKTHKIQDGGMFTWKFKMAAIFCKIVYVFTDP